MPDDQRPRVDEDDDLDELDDVLDEFQAGPSALPKSPPAQPAPATATAPTSTQSDAEIQAELASAFGAEFAKEMDSFLKNLKWDLGSPDSAADRDNLAAAWDATPVGGTSNPSGSTTGAKTLKQEDFQSSIRSTMNKLKESESGLKSSDGSTNSDGLQDIEAMLASLGSWNLNADMEGAEGEDKLQGALEAMMSQLMSREVLYEPLKELNDKFPDYLTKNSGTISPEDKPRFEAQISCIKQLLAVFDAPKYNDEGEETRKKIVDLMGELQSHGSPPEEIMGPLPPGFNMGSDGLPDLPEDCKVN